MNEYKITKYSDLNSDIIVFEYVKAEELRINPCGALVFYVNGVITEVFNSSYLRVSVSKL